MREIVVGIRLDWSDEHWLESAVPVRNVLILLASPPVLTLLHNSH